MRDSRQLRRAAPVLALIAALLAACGGGDTDDVVEPDPVESAPAAPESGTDTEESDNDGPAEASVGSLEEILSRYADSLGRPGQVVYEWQAAGVGAGAQMTIAQDPPNIAYRIESPEGAFHTITGDVNVVCFGTNGAWQCMPSESGMAGVVGGNPLDDVYDLDDVEASGIDPSTVTFSAEMIAGRSATCMSVPESDDVTNLVMCVDDETGMMLRTSGDTPEGSFSMEALTFTDTPDPSMFTAPGEMVDIPGMPTG